MPRTARLMPSTACPACCCSPSLVIRAQSPSVIFCAPYASADAGASQLPPIQFRVALCVGLAPSHFPGFLECAPEHPLASSQVGSSADGYGFVIALTASECAICATSSDG